MTTALADRYVIERELRRRGMATVYLARDLKHDRLVALKVLHSELAATLGPERFQREIKLAARLQHPNILTVLESGEAAGHLWFTMPYVEGESLRDRLRHEGQLPLALVLSPLERVRGIKQTGKKCQSPISTDPLVLRRDKPLVLAVLPRPRHIWSDSPQRPERDRSDGLRRG